MAGRIRQALCRKAAGGKRPLLPGWGLFGQIPGLTRGGVIRADGALEMGQRMRKYQPIGKTGEPGRVERKRLGNAATRRYAGRGEWRRRGAGAWGRQEEPAAPPAIRLRV